MIRELQWLPPQLVVVFGLPGPGKLKGRPLGGGERGRGGGSNTSQSIRVRRRRQLTRDLQRREQAWAGFISLANAEEDERLGTVHGRGESYEFSPAPLR